MKILFAFPLVVVCVGVFLFPAFSDAASIIPCGGEGQPACTFCHIFELTNNVIIFLLVPSAFNGGAALVLIAAAILFALGGFFIFSSAGNMARLEQGKKIITATVIGLLIVYCSYLFIGFLLEKMGVAGWTGLGTWWSITC